MGGDFVHMEEITADAQLVDRTVKEWAEGLSRQDREHLVDTVYEALSDSGAETTEELAQPKYLKKILQYLSENDDTKNLITREFWQILKAAGTAMGKLKEE